MTDRRGVAMVMALLANVLVLSFAVLALQAVTSRVRFTADARWRTEGWLVAASGLASVRVAAHGLLDTLSDGTVAQFAPVARGDGWWWNGRAERRGALVRVVVTAYRRGADGAVVAARQATLILARDPADTLRVIGWLPRF